MTEQGRPRDVLVVGHGPTSDAVADALATEVSVERADPDAVAGRVDRDTDAVVVVDSPPERDAVEVFEAVRSAGSLRPVLAVTTGGADRVASLRTAGVSDAVLWRDGDGAAELRARVEALARVPTLDGAAQGRRWADVASDLSHDAKNPLNVIAGRLELLDVDETHADALDRSVDSVETLLSELSTLGSVSRLPDESEPVSLAGLAEQVWGEFDTVDATLDVATDRTVSAPRESLRELLRRLLENALVHAGDDVTVTVTGTEDGFAVADDGPGIDPDDRERVFEQGYATSHEREGYGLFVVDRLAARNDWTVTVGESDAGGARIDVTVE
ncbi:sensor histidine kinase [Haloarcula litorea]|uniref:sensor histidine kinase n=1 Tax=Haloarcula litorea TaxID=3032579 RepID=UPI0023E84456|nr:HAMP domain-containing sensor histidine kinase [Halomicroarcula sp. GDY20]